MPRLFGPSTVGNIVTNFSQVFDASQVSTDGGTTGMYRSMQVSDFSNISITGNANVTGTVNVITTGNFQTLDAANSTPNNYTQSGSAGQTLLTGQILAANSSRSKLFIQNIGSGSVLYVKFGAAPASQQSFSTILSPSTIDFGGNGGVYSDNGSWRGIVSISGQTRMIAWEA